MSLEIIEDHLLWPTAIPLGARVIDCGANVGEFSRKMVHRFQADCVALEPVASYCEEIKKPIQAMQIALASRCGHRQFRVSEHPLESSFIQSDCHNSKAIGVNTTTLPVLMSELGWHHVDVVKIDIEGAEIEALDACRDDTLSAIGQLTVEFHDFNQMVTIVDVKRVVMRLRALGFYSFSRFRGCYYDTLFVNRNSCGMSKYRQMNEKLRLLRWGFGRRLHASLSYSRIR
jgi:FkbM family methyltransferase